MRALLCLVLLVLASSVQADPPGVDKERLQRIDTVVREAIDRGELPGAVVLVLHKGEVIHRKEYGLRSKKPAETPMTEDTVFDLASLTKPIATATSIMMLIEQGKLRPSDKVSEHLPDFAANGKESITVEQLLTHTSGLLADNPVTDYLDGHDKALERIYQLNLTAEPGTRFIYSDVNFIVLGELVGKLAGIPLDEFSAKNVFVPLGMKETGFRPGDKLKERAAPTEARDGRFQPGVVHDPRSFHLGGVAGHAGLFSTAGDLALYARMILNGGELNGKRILAASTVRLMTTPRPVPLASGGPGLRALGWDVDTSYSANRGELFPRGRSFGHTGFTGTSIWIDPDGDTAVIFLSNRVHPDGKGNVNRLRGQVATIAASALPPVSAKRLHPVLTGIDVLVRDRFAPLKGAKVGLVTNHTGQDRDGHATIDLMHQAEGVKLVALFSPEHGIRGVLDEKVGDGKDEKTGLPVWSLYGQRRKPTKETLEGVDTLVYDIQDIGCRFYTYISTLGLVLEAAAEHKLKVVVLDRPNPIGGVEVEGPVLDAGRESFVGWHTLPVRHSLTVGELAKLFNAERKIGADLTVIPVEGWRRGDTFDQTGLTWVNPSPNMRCLTAALLYPGIGLLETTNVSVGRGTERPFEWVGAPWLDGRKLQEALAAQNLPGVRFVPLKQTP
ncbi:MAG TPA: exo-beta-N-acetylmuramidase NamZ domain-containing protein, partial [Gemmataceae bacterium]|nr:exo-beta-N-acetylmuramidase NamZ domain-containing protein [Gemmataceae bacterium]